MSRVLQSRAILPLLESGELTVGFFSLHAPSVRLALRTRFSLAIILHHLSDFSSKNWLFRSLDSIQPQLHSSVILAIFSYFLRDSAVSLCSLTPYCLASLVTTRTKKCHGMKDNNMNTKNCFLAIKETLFTLVTEKPIYHEHRNISHGIKL